MKKSYEKEEQAFRLMQAMSGVDEELLERSEQEQPERQAGIYQFMRKYGKACAAGFCLITLGAALWAAEIYGLRSDDKMAGGAVERAAEQITEGAPEEAAMVEANMEDAAKEEAPQEACGTEVMENETRAGNKNEMEVTASLESVKMLSLEEVYERYHLGEHIPTELPEGYEFQYACDNSVEGMQNSVTLLWNNGETDLWLQLTQTDMTTDMRFDAEPPIFTVEEDWKNLLPEKDEDGGRRFGILFEDGVLVEYHGYLSEEELNQIFSFSNIR